MSLCKANHQDYPGRWLDRDMNAVHVLTPGRMRQGYHLGFEHFHPIMCTAPEPLGDSWGFVAVWRRFYFVCHTIHRRAPYSRDIDFVPESMSAMNALKLMRQRRLHMVVVVDEYGGTSGEQPTLHTEILTGP
eukprot:scaffold168914_cov32-Tisochrysis_lutea.AAC.3